MKKYLFLRWLAYLVVLSFFVSCKKDLVSTNTSQPSSESVSELAAPGAVLSQTRTANLFNCFGEGVLLLWEQQPGGARHVSADDGLYAFSKKLSPSRGTLQLQLHDFWFNIDAGATIQNITVNARRFKTGKGSIRDYFAHLIKKDDLRPTSFRAYGVRWMNPDYYPNTENTANYFQNGSGIGMFGNYQWTAEMINAVNFGLRITTYEPTVSSVVVYYDQVTITVQYSLPEGPSS